MTISGLQKMTLLDYPGKVACTVFLQGCNYRCPFCHNSGLLGADGEPFMEMSDFLDFLKKRQGLLDAVCVSGGEPTLQKELPALLKGIQALGFSVKLDTNGSRPEVLKELVKDGLVNYAAMDVKNSPGRYAETTGVSRPDLDKIEESLRFLIEGNVAYELRTTVVAELHSEQSVTEMGQWLSSIVPGKKPEKLFLQCFADQDSVLKSGLKAPDEAQLKRYAALLTPYVGFAAVRGL